MTHKGNKFKINFGLKVKVSVANPFKNSNSEGIRCVLAGNTLIWFLLFDNFKKNIRAFVAKKLTSEPKVRR